MGVVPSDKNRSVAARPKTDFGFATSHAVISDRTVGSWKSKPSSRDTEGARAVTIRAKCRESDLIAHNGHSCVSSETAGSGDMLIGVIVLALQELHRRRFATCLKGITYATLLTECEPRRLLLFVTQ